MKEVHKIKKKRIFWVSAGMVFVLGGIQLLLLRYFYFSRYNIHAQRVAEKCLSRQYNQEFELIETEFETQKAGESEYIRKWIYTMQDSMGRQFFVCTGGYYGTSMGAFYHPDYYNSASDTYCQVRIEEYLEKEYGLSRYRIDTTDVFPENSADYIFVCTEENEDNIAEILTRIYFTETEFSYDGCLYCLVKNQDGEMIYSYRRSLVKKELQDKDTEITEKSIYDHFLQQIR